MLTFDLVAHRGYPKRFPDNSLAGIRAAIGAGARYLEIDVQVSTDGTPWLFHDETLQRVCGVPGRFVDLDDAAIRELRAAETARLGERFADEPVARLVDVGAVLTAAPQVFTFVEIKPVALEARGVVPVVEAVLAELEGLADRVAVISFDFEALVAARERARHPIAPIVKDWAQVDGEAGDLDPEYLFCDVRRLPEEGPLEIEPALAVYEVVDPDQALELGRRGAEFVETFAFAEMHDALDLRDE